MGAIQIREVIFDVQCLKIKNMCLFPTVRTYVDDIIDDLDDASYMYVCTRIHVRIAQNMQCMHVRVHAFPSLET